MGIEAVYQELKTPCYVVDESLVKKNLEILKYVIDQTGCKILLAQKAFSMYAMYPLIGRYLHGAVASGLYEARLAHEEMRGENHVFSPAYRDEDMPELLSICDHMVFNSFRQWETYRGQAMTADVECGLRINPECSTQDHAIYDPCAPGSRLGIRRSDFCPELLDGISGLHFHTLCEQNVDALEMTVNAVEESFGEFLKDMKWLNFGGGHHITRQNYDVERLIRLINRVQEQYGIQVYLEPGEAVVLNTGFLVTEVLEIVRAVSPTSLQSAGIGELPVLIMDTSAACHMPDVLEMPYRPEIIGAGQPGEKPYTYRLGGPTCLAGDIIGDYSFDRQIDIGEKLTLCDMALYSMVKNNTFNGMPLPDIITIRENSEVEVVKQFGYNDFKGRLS